MRLLPLVLLACTKKAPDTAVIDTGTPDTGTPDTGELNCVDPTVAPFLAAYGGPDAFSDLYVEALHAFMGSDRLMRAGEYAAAADCLDDLFAAHPTGTAEWGAQDGQQHGTNIGAPVAYYGARMLRDVVATHLADPPDAVATATLTVVTVGCSEGVQPTTWAELDSGTGTAVTNRLDDGLTDAIVLQSLQLFGDYVWAITDGQLALDVVIHPLPDTCVPVSASSDGYRTATVGSLGPVWDATPELATDWWWVIYPSHVPEQYADFEDTEFITGGMGVGPDGRSPGFIIDDRWLLRKPPHLGDGPYTDIERRAYLPQWLQHEFMHHLFRTYPEYGLEETSHQWFDRTTWPSDFEGTYEADYYAEAVHKRLQSADPPMHVALRYAPPPADVLAQLTTADVLGTYDRQPVENDWHTGTIATDGSALSWTNEAGASWSLTADLATGRLLTAEDCPYYDSGGRAFTLELARDDDGNYLPTVTAFWFTGERYAKR
jgi:hypothetical protein